MHTMSQYHAIMLPAHSILGSSILHSSFMMTRLMVQEQDVRVSVTNGDITLVNMRHSLHKSKNAGCPEAQAVLCKNGQSTNLTLFQLVRVEVIKKNYILTDIFWIPKGKTWIMQVKQ